VTPDLRIVIEGDGTLESGRHAVEQLFMRDTLPTAFMCVNDQTAIGVMIGLKARGYDIPEDFSVTGFDDVPQAVFMSPSLTTIRQPRTAIGKHAMALLLELLSDGQPTETEILLLPDLVVRNSVSAPSRMRR
jgi:LacI family repressor for deo operon, udp, cdd, tsx, nupC, and nupG